MITDEDTAKAIDRIARTPDGKLLYLHLQKRLLGVLGQPNPESGALQMDHGARTFASNLMGLMAAGIDESAGSATDQSSERAADRPVVFRVAPRVVGQPRLSARERIAANDPELIALRNAADQPAAS